MNTQNHPKTSLFSRIVIRLCLPLIILGILFTGIQLGNQINILNELRQLSSQIAIEAVLTEAENEIQKSGSLVKSEAFESRLAKISRVHNIQGIQIFGLLTQSLLLSTSEEPWSSQDLKSSDQAMRKLSEGKKHYVRIDRVHKKLEAYLPVREKQSSNVYIIKASFSLANVKDALSTSRSTLILIIFFILLTGALIAYSLSRSIVRPITDLHRATQAIMEGTLGSHVKIKTNDEIQALAEAFNHMSDTLKDMKKSAEDANPLTGLPGNQGIFKIVQERIQNHQKFVFFHADLDRFKLFNDQFGLAKGDIAIKETAAALKQAVKEMGRASDFVGHQGGDDFVLIAHPDYAEKLGKRVCELFTEKVVNKLYPKEDLNRGFTLQLDRRGLAETGIERTREFPLMSISLAGISNKDKDIPDYFHCMNAAVAAKKEAKEIVENSCIIKPYEPQH